MRAYSIYEWYVFLNVAGSLTAVYMYRGAVRIPSQSVETMPPVSVSSYAEWFGAFYPQQITIQVWPSQLYSYVLWTQHVRGTISKITTARQLFPIIKTSWQWCQLSRETFRFTYALSIPAQEPVSVALVQHHLDNLHISIARWDWPHIQCKERLSTENLTETQRTVRVQLRCTLHFPLWKLQPAYDTKRLLRRGFSGVQSFISEHSAAYWQNLGEIYSKEEKRVLMGFSCRLLSH